MKLSINLFAVAVVLSGSISVASADQNLRSLQSADGESEGRERGLKKRARSLKSTKAASDGRKLQKNKKALPYPTCFPNC